MPGCATDTACGYNILMLPTLRQRLFMALALVVGIVCMLLIAGPLSPYDASTGMTLLDARVGPIPAAALVVLASVPLILAATVAGALGNPLTGVFIYAVSVAVLAGSGGSSGGFLRRASLPGGYLWLIAEMLAWLALHLMLLYLLVTLREPLRRRLRDFASPTYELALPIGRANLAASMTGMLLVAALGGLLTHLLVQSADTGQVIGGLICAFALAGLLGKTIAGQMSASAGLLAPLLVGVVGYAWTAAAGTTLPGGLEEAWYRGDLSGVALALPIHYASAGIAGAAVGLGIGQGMMSSEHRAEEERVAAQLALESGWYNPFAPTSPDSDDSSTSA